MSNQPHSDMLRAACTANGLKYVGTRGNTSAPICIVGEAPGEEEAASGLPFIGSSGRLQDKILAEVGFRGDCWFTNPYKVRPPDNKIDQLSTLGVPLDLFTNQFFEELTTYKPTIIVSCGKTPTNLLCPITVPLKRGSRGKDEDVKKDGFGQWRGSLLTSPHLTWPHYVIPVYHPAFVLRNWSERQVSALVYKRALEELRYYNANGALCPLPTRTLRDDPSYDEVVQYLEECYAQPDPVSIDIEMFWVGKKFTKTTPIQLVNILGIAKNPWDGLAFSIFDLEGDRLAYVMRLFDRILHDKDIIGQNFTVFDAHWLGTIGLRTEIKHVQDTLIRHHTLWPELEHTLAFMVMQYTREPFYKLEGKVFALGTNARIVRRYCCKDVCCTYEVFQQQELEFDQQVKEASA